MPNYDGSLNFNTRIDERGFNQGVRSLGLSAKKLGVIIAAAFSTKALIDFSKQAIETASDLQEVQNVVDTVFKEMSADIDEFSKTALEKFGLSELSAKKYASTLGAMLKPTGLATDKIAEMSTELTGAVGGMSSFFNRSADVIAQDIQSYFAGSAETMYKYGLNAQIANLESFALAKGINKSFKEMSQAEKQLVRYNFLVENLGYTFNDFEKTQDSWANQTRILTERWKQFLGLIGQNLITVFTPAVKLLNQLLSSLIAATQQFNAFYSAITGAQIDQQSEITNQIGDSVKEQDKLTGAVKDTNKELKKSLAGFDEINVLQQESLEASGAETFQIASQIQTEVVQPEQPQDISPILEKLLSFLEPLQTIDLTNLNSSLERFKDSVIEFISIDTERLKRVYTDFLIPLAKYTLEDALPAGLDVLTSSINLLTAAFDIAQPALDTFVSNFLVPVAQWAGDKAVDIFNDLNKEIREFTKVLKGNEGQLIVVLDKITELALIIFTVVKPQLEALYRTFQIVFGGASEILRIWFESTLMILNGLLDFIIGIFTLDWERAWSGLVNIVLGIWNLWTKSTETILKTVWKLFKNAWDNIVDTTGNQLIFIIELGLKFLDWMNQQVIQPLAAFFSGLWDGVVESFNKMGDALKAGFTNIINFFLGLAEKFFNFFIDGINSLISGLNKIKLDVPDWVPQIGGKKFGVNIPKISGVSIPRLATGAVIPPNAEFLAVLGDQKSGNNIEAPESLIRQIVQEESGGNGGEIVIKFDSTMAQFVRLLSPMLDQESQRKGAKMRVVTE